VELVEFGRLTPEYRAQLEGEEKDPYGAAGNRFTWQPKHRHVGLRDEGRLVASTGLVVVDVEVAGEVFPVVGVGGVIVARAHRGRGLMRRVLEAALERAATLGPERALLFCSLEMSRRYVRFGFHALTEPVVVDQPDGTAEMGVVCMWRALHAGATWPEGPVRLLGLPF
jgi:predicted GNAT family N-acyltransferase